MTRWWLRVELSFSYFSTTFDIFILLHLLCQLAVFGFCQLSLISSVGLRDLDFPLKLILSEFHFFFKGPYSLSAKHVPFAIFQTSIDSILPSYLLFATREVFLRGKAILF